MASQSSTIMLILWKAFYTFSVSQWPYYSGTYPTTDVEIVIETATRTNFRLKLLIDNNIVDIQRQEGTTWVPHRSL
jgi:hypothetical protein